MAVDEHVKQYLTLGREFFESGEYNKAERYLARLVEAGDCQFADVYNMLGIIYHNQGRFPKAETAFEEATRINPKYTEAALNLAVTYNELGKYQEARQTYEGALARSRARTGGIDPFVKGKIANMHADLGDVYRSIGQYLAAVREYKKAMELGPGFVDIRRKLGTAYQEMGDNESAIEEFQRILREREEYLPAHISLGLTFHAEGDRQKALAQFERALELEPDNARAALYLRMVKDAIERDGA